MGFFRNRQPLLSILLLLFFPVFFADVRAAFSSTALVKKEIRKGARHRALLSKHHMQSRLKNYSVLARRHTITTLPPRMRKNDLLIKPFAQYYIPKRNMDWSKAATVVLNGADKVATGFADKIATGVAYGITAVAVAIGLVDVQDAWPDSGNHYCVPDDATPKAYDWFNEANAAGNNHDLSYNERIGIVSRRVDEHNRKYCYEQSTTTIIYEGVSFNIKKVSQETLDNEQWQREERKNYNDLSIPNNETRYIISTTTGYQLTLLPGEVLKKDSSGEYIFPTEEESVSTVTPPKKDKPGCGAPVPPQPVAHVYPVGHTPPTTTTVFPEAPKEDIRVVCEAPPVDTVTVLEAKSPGVPELERDGFEKPKGWDGKAVRFINNQGKWMGVGYPDRWGNVWIPAGVDGHGGEHWDVQFPRGKRGTDGKTYANVYPGGKIRGKVNGRERFVHGTKVFNACAEAPINEIESIADTQSEVENPSVTLDTPNDYVYQQQAAVESNNNWLRDSIIRGIFGAIVKEGINGWTRDPGSYAPDISPTNYEDMGWVPPHGPDRPNGW